MDRVEDGGRQRLRQIETANPCTQGVVQWLYRQTFAFIWRHHPALLLRELEAHGAGVIIEPAILHDQEHRPAVAAIVV